MTPSRPTARLGGVPIGGAAPVVVMGVLNVSAESFYRGSVYGADALLDAALAMVDAGAALLDIGAMSTAPYGRGRIDVADERERLIAAVDVVAAKTPVPISVDTARAEAADAALDAGAVIVNDVGGLADPALVALLVRRDVPVIVMASPTAAAACSVDITPTSDPIAVVTATLVGSLVRARDARMAPDRIVIDPGIGFFLDDRDARAAWDVRVLADLPAFEQLGHPLAVGVSRKSFVGTVTGRTDPGDRLAGSLAATAIAVLGGAALIRTHDVAETRDAVRLAERVGDARRA